MQLPCIQWTDDPHWNKEYSIRISGKFSTYCSRSVLFVFNKGKDLCTGTDQPFECMIQVIITKYSAFIPSSVLTSSFGGSITGPGIIGTMMTGTITGPKPIGKSENVSGQSGSMVSGSFCESDIFWIQIFFSTASFRRKDETTVRTLRFVNCDVSLLCRKRLFTSSRLDGCFAAS